MTEKEDGVQAGSRNVGRFFLSLIPWALGLGATVWITAWISVERYKAEEMQARRSAVYTGGLPQDRPIKFQVQNDTCIVIVRADVVWPSLVVNAQNNCRRAVAMSYLEWHWELLAPDGTAIYTGYTNGCPVPQSQGDRAECKQELTGLHGERAEADRIETVKLWLKTS